MTMAAALKVTRLVHRYSGLFFAPTILFFAITGGLQMFGLHETSRGNSYVPPAVLVRLSQLHKKGTLYLPPRRVTPAVANKPDLPKPPEGPPPLPAHNRLPTRIFFAATALALLVSTRTGIVMAGNSSVENQSLSSSLAAGILFPVILLVL
jgi:hypothetical protein